MQVMDSQRRENSPMHKYIIMGVQGCGKGTQARLLKEWLDLVHISVGDMFRWHIQSHTKLGARIKRLVAEGELVPDDVVEDVVKQRLEQHDWNYGFILDGFPRNARQAAFFLESYDIDAVLLIEVPDAVVQERILNRRLCPTCGLDYNLIFHRPAVANTCDNRRKPQRIFRRNALPMIRRLSLLRNFIPLARTLLMCLMDAWRFLRLC